MVKRFHGSRRFIFTGSWSATHVLLSFVFFNEKQAIRRRQFAAIDCDVFMCGSFRIAGSELPRGLGAYVSPYLYSAINVQCKNKIIIIILQPVDGATIVAMGHRSSNRSQHFLSLSTSRWCHRYGNGPSLFLRKI